MSKAHPGLSEAYEHKKRVRDTRHLERDLHQDAVSVYKQQQLKQTETESGLKWADADLNRNTIKRIKKEIVK